MTQSPNPRVDSAFVGVVMPLPLRDALRATAEARGVSQSQLVRDAIALNLAIPNNSGRPSSKPAQEK